MQRAAANASGRARVPVRVRQADIARAAGVSQATVSMVLGDGSNPSARVSEATRRQILTVARDLGYSVNPVARNLAGGRNRLLGVYTFEAVFPTAGRDFYQPFLFGIEHEAAEVGYDLLLFTSASMPGQPRSIYAGGVNRLALSDGSILLGRQDNKAEIARLARDGFPFVYIGRRDVAGAEFSYVTADYPRATGQVMDHLVDLGHRGIVYLGVRHPHEPDRDRERGWSDSLQRLGLSPTDCLLVRSDGRRSLAALVTQLRHVHGTTALVVEDPEAAPDVFAAVTEAGFDVPGDVSVAVLGDDPSAGTFAESWTGFQIPREEMGRQAVRLLLRAVEPSGGPPRQVVVPCPVVTGDTAAAPAPVSRPPRRRTPAGTSKASKASKASSSRRVT